MSTCPSTCTLTDFEQKVLSDLAELKANMRWIIGNGNQGKMQEIEERVERHEAYLQRFAGIATAVGALLTCVSGTDTTWDSATVRARCSRPFARFLLEDQLPHPSSPRS